jgi:hypothetical protein
MILTEEAQRKWQPVLEHPDLPKITDAHRRAVTAVILENTEQALRETGRQLGGQRLLGETVQTGADIDNFDPVLISLVRRSMPNLIAYDICGVQPMTGPTGLIFAMRAKYSNSSNSGVEAFYNEANTGFATLTAGSNTIGQQHVGTVPGNTSVTANLAFGNAYNFGTGMATANAEALGISGGTAFPEMAFSIEKENGLLLLIPCVRYLRIILSYACMDRCHQQIHCLLLRS